MANITIATPTIDRGIVTTGMITDRIVPRKRKMTMMTMITASLSVVITSRMAETMNSEAS